MRTLLIVACSLLASEVTGAQPAEPIGRLEFSVRAAKPAELPADTSREWLPIAGRGAATAAAGTVMAPFLAGTFIVGGLLLGPGLLIVSGMERRTWEKVTAALRSVDFEKGILGALQRRGARAFPGGDGKVASVEVIVNAYGLRGARPEHACFVADADAVMRADGVELMRTRLRIAETDASPDAPPEQCASLDRFAASDGQLVRDTAVEYGEVLAAMTIDRVAAALKR